MIRVTGFIVVGLIVVGAAHCLRAEAGGKSETKVKATATATKLDKNGMQKVTITLDIDKSWYVYANPVGDKDFADNRTTISFKANGKVVADVKYPVGKGK